MSYTIVSERGNEVVYIFPDSVIPAYIRHDMSQYRIDDVNHEYHQKLKSRILTFLQQEHLQRFISYDVENDIIDLEIISFYDL